MKAMLKVLLVALLGCAARVNAYDFVDEAHVEHAALDHDLLHNLGDLDLHLPHFKLAELAAHNSKDDCWVAYHGKVFDASPLLAAHCPAGFDKFVGVCGADVTAFLRGAHAVHFNGHLDVAGVAHCPAFQFHGLFRLLGFLDEEVL